MPVYTVVDDVDDPGPIQHPAITLVDPDGGPYNPATSIPDGTYADAVSTTAALATRPSTAHLGWFIVDAYAGADADAKFAAALAAWEASSVGGTIFFGPNSYSMANAWQPMASSLGAARFDQKFLRITGCGAGHNGQWLDPIGGTVIDMTYNGSAPAKIDTRGRGTIEIDHIYFKDSSGSTKPFFQTTNTTPDIHDCAFQGSKTSSWDQDAIVLGGTTTTLDGSSDAAFQGYGGRGVRGNYFDKIRRGVYCRTFCNGVPITGNTWSTRCGASASAAAIEIYGGAGQNCTGINVRDNVIECVNYVYPVLADNALLCTFGPNGLFDPGAGTLACYRFGAGGNYNVVIDGHRNDTKPLISEHPTAANSNCTQTAHQAQRSDWTQPWRFTNTVEFAGGSGIGPQTLDNGGGGVRWRASTASNGVTRAIICAIPPTQVTDAVTTSGSQTVTSAANGFTGAVAGMPISGTGIPGGTFIAPVPAPTAGSVTMTKNATASATITANFGKQGTELQMTAFHNHHIISSGSSPTPVVDAAAGGGATVTLVGTDMSMTVTLTTGTSPTSGQLYHMSAALAWSFSPGPRISVTPRNQAAANFLRTADVWWTTGASVGNAIIMTVGTAPPASTALIFDLILMG